MRFLPFISLAMVGFILAGCVNEQDQRLQIAKTLVQVDRQLPDVPTLPPARLNKIVFDFPRDMAQKLIKKTPACVNREDQTSVSFVKECTYYPILRKSNIFIGLDRTNFQKLNENLDILIARNQQNEARIAEINRQRAIDRGEVLINPPPVSNPVTRINPTIQLTQ